MDLDTLANRNELIKVFPLLKTDQTFKITSNSTAMYNCIAWAMGFTDRWVDITDKTELDVIGGRFTWWPAGVDQTREQESLRSAFEVLGFETSISDSYEDGFDKAALYSKDGQWTHASRILSDVEEHSKFGESWNAHHGRNLFSGSIYGEVFCYMRREHSRKKEFVDKFPLKIGTITINSEKAKPVLNLMRARIGLSPTPNIS